MAGQSLQIGLFKHLNTVVLAWIFCNYLKQHFINYWRDKKVLRYSINLVTLSKSFSGFISFFNSSFFDCFFSQFIICPFSISLSFYLSLNLSIYLSLHLSLSLSLSHEGPNLIRTAVLCQSVGRFSWRYLWLQNLKNWKNEKLS